ncbi:uncharacterized protein lectin-24A [Drosophila kikkawai]|uniref:Uncharacterized protein lectin-24A n=1 Tax=Drosophila kikkawai TaxID=30033 RepID=A0ABM4GA39_DROKI
MLKFLTYLLLAVAASSAEDLQSGYVCLIDKPNPQQCDNFCLNTLEPLLNKISQRRDEGITCNADEETKTKLDRLEVKMEEQLKQVREKLEGQLGGIERNLLTAQTGLVGQLQMDLITMKAQLQEIINKMNDFKRIGSRYFRIVEEKVNWFTAKKKCFQLGGYLAAFQSKMEFKAIGEKLKENENYWLGINALENEGHYVSMASGQPPPFVDWGDGPALSSRCGSIQNGKIMLRLITYLLLAVAASSAEDLQSGYVCLIDEPNEVQQCENLCLNRLKPLPNKISQRQNHNGNGKKKGS